MSILNDTHTFIPFDSKTSKAAEGQRLAKVLYKTPKDGSEKQQSVCASVPKLAAPSTQELQALMPHILQMLEDTQDAICRDAHEKHAISVTSAELSIAACSAFLDAESRGDRLTKEMIAAWFASSVQDMLTIVIADKLQLPDVPSAEQTIMLNQQINVFRDKFCSLAGGRTSFSKEVAQKLHRVLELAASPDDVLGAKFKLRLQKMQQEAADAMMAL